MLADVLGDDRFSPGVSCCVILDQPVGKLFLESVLITHTSDIILDKSDTIVDCGRSDLYLTIGLDSDSSDFPDTGHPDFCFGMPRSPNGIGNVESDVDTVLLARGSCSRTLTPWDGRLEFAPMSPGLPVRKDLPVREDCGLYKGGSCQYVAIS